MENYSKIEKPIEATLYKKNKPPVSCCVVGIKLTSLGIMLEVMSSYGLEMVNPDDVIQNFKN